MYKRQELKRANEILGAAGLKVSAVQNHFSLLHRSSERAGILEYCKENGLSLIHIWELIPPGRERLREELFRKGRDRGPGAFHRR